MIRRVVRQHHEYGTLLAVEFEAQRKHTKKKEGKRTCCSVLFMSDKSSLTLARSTQEIEADARPEEKEEALASLRPANEHEREAVVVVSSTTVLRREDPLLSHSITGLNVASDTLKQQKPQHDRTSSASSLSAEVQTSLIPESEVKAAAEAAKNEAVARLFTTPGLTFYLNVYDLVPPSRESAKGVSSEVLNVIGMGLYHSGIEFLGQEYSFGSDESGRNDPNTEGVYSVYPRTACSHFKTQIALGDAPVGFSPDDLEEILASLRPKWRSSSYHILTHNCNHFTKQLIKAIDGYFHKDCPSTLKLAPKYPSWVNRAAKSCGLVVPASFVRNITDAISPPTACAPDLVNFIDIPAFEGEYPPPLAVQPIPTLRRALRRSAATTEREEQGAENKDAAGEKRQQTTAYVDEESHVEVEEITHQNKAGVPESEESEERAEAPSTEETAIAKKTTDGGRDTNPSATACTTYCAATLLVTQSIEETAQSNGEQKDQIHVNGASSDGTVATALSASDVSPSAAAAANTTTATSTTTTTQGDIAALATSTVSSWITSVTSTWHQTMSSSNSTTGSFLQPQWGGASSSPSQAAPTTTTTFATASCVRAATTDASPSAANSSPTPSSAALVGAFSSHLALVGGYARRVAYTVASTVKTAVATHIDEGDRRLYLATFDGVSADDLLAAYVCTVLHVNRPQSAKVFVAKDGLRVKGAHNLHTLISYESFHGYYYGAVLRPQKTDGNALPSFVPIEDVERADCILIVLQIEDRGPGLRMIPLMDLSYLGGDTAAARSVGSLVVKPREVLKNAMSYLDYAYRQAMQYGDDQSSVGEGEGE